MSWASSAGATGLIATPSAGFINTIHYRVVSPLMHNRITNSCVNCVNDDGLHLHHFCIDQLRVCVFLLFPMS